MSHDPALAIVDYLDADSALGLTKGVDLFKGNVRGQSNNIPIKAVFVTPSTSEIPDRVMGQGKEIKRALLMIRVRWDTFGAGDLMSRNIMNTLQGKGLVSYLDQYSTQSLPISLGQDGEGHYMWVLDIVVVYEETAL